MISLPQSVKRREKSVLAAMLAGLNVTIVTADTGFDDRFLGGAFKGRLSGLSGTAGCAVSHVKLLIKLSEKGGSDPVLILEDDFIVNKDFKPFWGASLSSLPPCWAIAHASPWDHKCKRNPRISERWVSYQGKGITGTHAYSVIPDRIKTWLPLVLPLLEEVDLHFMKNWRLIPTYMQVERALGGYFGNSIRDVVDKQRD